MNYNDFDLSTINTTKLKELPVYVPARPGHHLQEHPGNGCYGDPPGYPTYFTRSIYTSQGNSPSKGPYTELLGHTLPDDYWEGDKPLLDSLYLPLPEEHPRVQAWIANTYRHMAHCYADDTQLKASAEHVLVFPVPSYKLLCFHDDHRFSDEWRQKDQARVAEANAVITAYATALAIPDNHMAVRAIRKHYPNHQPRLGWITGGVPTDEAPFTRWWERHSYCPEPADCPGDLNGRSSHIVGSGKYCQFCGRTA